MRYVHRVNVTRQLKTNTAGVVTSVPSTVLTCVKCLVEPLPLKARASILGEIPQAQWHITWGTDAIIQDDVILWNLPSGDGKSYVIKRIISDTLRSKSPYQTGVLIRQAGR